MSEPTAEPPSEVETAPLPAEPRQRLVRAAILLAGVVAIELFLFGPSLFGHKILLPVDLLAQERVYLPQTEEVRQIVPHYRVAFDPVLLFEIERRFVAAEMRAGRLPLWGSGQYGGAPAAAWPKYSPFSLLYTLFPSPLTLAWTRLLVALVAASGAFLFFRHALGIAFTPAVIGAWSYPISGFLIIWQGFPITYNVAWLPWLLLVVDAAIRRQRWAGPGLALLTAVEILSGVMDVAGLVLLASGLFAVWRLFELRHDHRRLLRVVALLVAAWGIGFLLAAPFWLPVGDYSSTSARFEHRGAGFEERPPVGLQALPQVIVPKVHGTSHHDSFRLVDGSLIESSAGAYAGILAALLLAPLAFTSVRHRSLNLFWALALVLGLGWVLNVPGLVSIGRLPGLNMFSWNRFVLLSGWAFLALATVGLDQLWRRKIERRWWFLVPVAALIVVVAYCFLRSENPPEPLASQLLQAVEAGAPLGIDGPRGVEQVAASFKVYQLFGALMATLGLLGWALVSGGQDHRRWLVRILGVALIAELLTFAHGFSTQAEPSLYYPKLPALTRLAEAPPGRVLGVSCLSPRLGEFHGLNDIRGYDGVDPRRIVEVLEIGRDRRYESPSYAVLQWYRPVIRVSPAGEVRLPPVVDMLGVRYLIFRGVPVPPFQPLIAEADYWVVENHRALPRAFVPQRLESVAAEEVLAKMAAADFDARRVAYTDAQVELPAPARGTATIVDEVPTQVTVEVAMETPGLVVLADNYDSGWNAELDGERVPVLRVNHTLRGVVVPAGRGRLVFRYQPSSLRWGLGGLSAGLVAAIMWSFLLWRRPGAS